MRITTSTEAESLLRGKRISRVRLNKFRNGRGGWSTDPELLLDSGDTLRFVVEETEDDYGVRLIVAPGYGRKDG